MSETVAIALISAVPTAAVALVALVGNFLLDQRRRTHEQGQLARQLEHEREMRLLEWKRADRLERLAPIRAYVDNLSREATAFIFASRVATRDATVGQEPHARSSAHPELNKIGSRLLAVLDQYQHVNWRCTLDEPLSLLLFDFAHNIRVLLEQSAQEAPEEDIEATESKLLATTAKLWDRLDELQSSL